MVDIYCMFADLKRFTRVVLSNKAVFASEITSGFPWRKLKPEIAVLPRSVILIFSWRAR